LTLFTLAVITQKDGVFCDCVVVVLIWFDTAKIAADHVSKPEWLTFACLFAFVGCFAIFRLAMATGKGDCCKVCLFFFHPLVRLH